MIMDLSNASDKCKQSALPAPSKGVLDALIKIKPVPHGFNGEYIKDNCHHNFKSYTINTPT